MPQCERSRVFDASENTVRQWIQRHGRNGIGSLDGRPRGGGVDGAIHRAAGPELLAECRAIGGCNTGDAVITQGHRLPAKYVMYTVGPIWQGGSAGEADLLASCYISSLKLAAKRGVRTLAFPSISTGAYRYPLEQASQIAMRTVTLRLKADPSIENVIFVCFNERTRDAYQRALDAELAIR